MQNAHQSLGLLSRSNDAMSQRTVGKHLSPATRSFLSLTLDKYEIAENRILRMV
jgi:hypothetical protein